MLRTLRPLNCLHTNTQQTLRRALSSTCSKPAVMPKPYSTLGKGVQPTFWHSARTSSPYTSTKLVGAVAGVMGTMTAGLWTKKPLHCQAVFTEVTDLETYKMNKAAREAKDADAKKSLFHKGELSFGVFLGFCTGYLIKKVGKFFALTVGVGFVFLQYLSFNGYVTVHWDRLEGGYKQQLGVDKDGKVTTQVVRSKWDKFTGFLTHNLQFKSTFLVGLYGGLRYG